MKKFVAKQISISVLAIAMVFLGLVYSVLSVRSAIRQKVLMKDAELVIVHKIRDKLISALDGSDINKYPRALEDFWEKGLITKDEYMFLTSHEARYFAPSAKRKPSDRVLICHLDSQKVWIVVFRSGIVKSMSEEAKERFVQESESIGK